MNTNRSALFFLVIALAFVQIVMVAAVGIVPVVQSAGSVALQTPLPLDLSTAIADLAAKADLVVQAQVIDARSQWNSSHTLIETVHKLAVRQSLVGVAPAEVTLYTDGGFLPAEGLGMFSSHTPTFAVGEETLVFIQQKNKRYQVVDGEAGKFTLLQNNVASAYYREHLPLAQVATILTTTKRARQQTALLTAEGDTVSTAPANPPINRLQPWATTTPMPKWSGETPKITMQVNLNSTQIGSQAGNADQFLTAIKNALRTWSVVPDAGVTLLYSGTTTSTITSLNRQSELVFMKKGANSQLGQAQIWFTSGFVIIEADLWINDDYVLDATGSPTGGAIDLESVVLHELGHWLPLNHMANTNAVMYAVLGAGMRKTVLNSDDIAGLTALYPCPAIPCIDPEYAGDATATPTATTTSVEQTTPTPTPTAMPSTVTPAPTPSAVTPIPQQNSFLPLVTR